MSQIYRAETMNKSAIEAELAILNDKMQNGGQLTETENDRLNELKEELGVRQDEAAILEATSGPNLEANFGQPPRSTYQKPINMDNTLAGGIASGVGIMALGKGAGAMTLVASASTVATLGAGLALVGGIYAVKKIMGASKANKGRLGTVDGMRRMTTASTRVLNATQRKIGRIGSQVRNRDEIAQIRQAGQQLEVFKKQQIGQLKELEKKYAAAAKKYNGEGNIPADVRSDLSAERQNIYRSAGKAQATAQRGYDLAYEGLQAKRALNAGDTKKYMEHKNRIDKLTAAASKPQSKPEKSKADNKSKLQGGIASAIKDHGKAQAAINKKEAKIHSDFGGKKEAEKFAKDDLTKIKIERHVANTKLEKSVAGMVKDKSNTNDPAKSRAEKALANLAKKRAAILDDKKMDQSGRDAAIGKAYEKFGSDIKTVSTASLKPEADKKQSDRARIAKNKQAAAAKGTKNHEPIKMGDGGPTRMDKGQAKLAKAAQGQKSKKVIKLDAKKSKKQAPDLSKPGSINQVDINPNPFAKDRVKSLEKGIDAKLSGKTSQKVVAEKFGDKMINEGNKVKAVKEVKAQKAQQEERQAASMGRK